jgi:hypothetical protein
MSLTRKQRDAAIQGWIEALLIDNKTTEQFLMLGEGIPALEQLATQRARLRAFKRWLDKR